MFAMRLKILLQTFSISSLIQIEATQNKGCRAKPLQFLEILKGFFACIKKGLLYQSSDSEVQKVLDSLKKGIELYSKMFSYTKDEKAGKIGLDPLLTIRNGVCYLEAFDKIR